MIQYGLDADTVRQIYTHGSQKNKNTYELGPNALVGLQNFYNNHPEKFLSRLSKGPPPSYRWIAWRFMSRIILRKDQCSFQKLVELGKDNKWLYDINKDLDRTYPQHTVFDL